LYYRGLIVPSYLSSTNCDSCVSGGFLVKQRIPAMYRRIEVKERIPAVKPAIMNIIPASLGFLFFQMLTIPIIVKIKLMIKLIMINHINPPTREKTE